MWHRTVGSLSKPQDSGDDHEIGGDLGSALPHTRHHRAHPPRQRWGDAEVAKLQPIALKARRGRWGEASSASGEGLAGRRPPQLS